MPKRISRSSRRLRVLSDDIVYRGDGVGAVHETRLRFPSGAVRLWTYLVKRPFVMVIAVHGNRVVLVRQRRYPRGPTWEVVKGGTELGETPLAAAKRELREETGFRARRWRRLGRIMVAPGYFNQFGFVYLATGLTPGKPTPESNGEILRWQLASPVRVRRMISRRQIYDSTTMAGLLSARKYFPL